MKKYNIKVNGIQYEVEVEEVGGGPAAAYSPVVSTPSPTVQQTPVKPAPAPTASAKADEVSEGALKMEAPMPGTILEVKVAPGDSVVEGQILLLLEAMKMENEIMSPRAGVVDAVAVVKGASVNTGDFMISLK